MGQKMSAAVNGTDVDRWSDDFAALWGHVGRCFFRHDLRTRAERYLRALMARVGR